MLQLKESITRWQQLRRWWQEWLVLKCLPHSTLVWLLANKIGQSEFKIMHPQQSFWKICLQKTAVWNQLCWRDVLENYVPNIWRLGRWWSDCGWHTGLVGEWAATWRETGKSNAAHQRKEHTTESRELYIQAKEVSYMGHLLTEMDLKPDPEKVAAIKNMHRPHNRKELQQYLGMVTYSGKFPPQLSDVTVCW